MKPWLALASALLVIGGHPGLISRAQGGDAAVAPTAANRQLDERFLAGLRSRRLFELAEAYCRRQLERGDLSDDRRAELVIELARTLAAQAIDSPRLSRDPLWRQADEAIDAFQRAHPRSPQTLALELQKALLALARGENERQEAEIGGLQRDSLEPARKSLRQAIALFKQLDETTKLELTRRARAQKAEPGEWSSAQLLSLQTNLRFQLARALVNQALCYLPDSSDRIGALSEAKQILEPLAQLVPETPLAWESRVEELRVYRLLRDFSAVERKLAAVRKEEPPAPYRERLVAEEIRLALDRGDVQRAVSLAGDPSRRAPSDGADLSFARFEAFVAAWRAQAERDRKLAGAGVAPVSQKPSDWETASVEQAKFLEQRFGAYWMRRAETLLATTIAVGAGENVESLTRAAAGYFRGGQFGDAVAAYDRAVKLLKQAGKPPENMFDLALAAATIEHQQGHAREALRRYLELSLAIPDHAKADEAHLLAIFNAARVADESSDETKAAAIDEYQRLLEEHLARWPSSATRGQAAWWLGQSQERARQWQAAAVSYALVPRGHPQFGPALAGLARCDHELLEATELTDEDRARQAATVAQWFAAVATTKGPTSTDADKRVERQAALFAAEFYLQANDHATAEQAAEILRTALADTSVADAEWRAKARTQLVLSLVAQAKWDEAGAAVESFAAAPLGEWLPLADQLSARAASGAASDRPAIAGLERRLLSFADAQTDKLTDADRRKLDLLRVQALADAGQHAESLTLIERLAADRPADGATQELLAEILTQGTLAEQKRALFKWREVQQKSRPGSQRWFRAGYGLAHTQFLLNNKFAAAAAIKVIAAAYPDLGGRELKARFEKLRLDCAKP
jgi:hypothetical protein